MRGVGNNQRVSYSDLDSTSRTRKSRYDSSTSAASNQSDEAFLSSYQTSASNAAPRAQQRPASNPKALVHLFISNAKNLNDLQTQLTQIPGIMTMTTAYGERTSLDNGLSQESRTLTLIFLRESITIDITQELDQENNETAIRASVR
jgi:hypothetical protein